MPTATTISQYPLVNLGPLTTTFTAPSSCATATASRFGLGVSVAPFWGSLRSEQCGPEQQLYTGSDTACFPSASARNDIFLSAQNRPWENYPVRYHFPGNACPSGWTTALAMTAGGTTSFEYDAAISSVFFSPQTYYSRHHDGAILMGGLPAVSILGDALAPGETAVGCCPSGYSAEPYGICYSGAPLSVYTATTACEVYPSAVDDGLRTTRTKVVTIHGETLTAHIMGYPDDVEFTTKTLRYTFTEPLREEPSVMTNLEGRGALNAPTVVYVEDMVLLVTGTATRSESTIATAEDSSEPAASSAASTGTGGHNESGAGSLQGGMTAKLVGVAVAAAMAVGLVGL